MVQLWFSYGSVQFGKPNSSIRFGSVRLEIPNQNAVGLKYNKKKVLQSNKVHGLQVREISVRWFCLKLAFYFIKYYKTFI